MIWPIRRKRAIRSSSRTVGLSVRGQHDPEMYQVCEDVFRIIKKMLRANQVIRPFSQREQFEFGEIAFLLALLGAPVTETEQNDYVSADLWISEG